jgi:hypothetical protein
MLRLIVTLFMCFFNGVLLSKEELFFHEKGTIAPYPILLTLAALGVCLGLILTAPRGIRLWLFLTAAAYTVLGFLISREKIFEEGAGSCSIVTLAFLAAALALVVLYPRKEPVPDKKARETPRRDTGIKNAAARPTSGPATR